MTTLAEIFLVLILVFLNGFFVMAEYSAVKLRTSQLEDLLALGDRRAHAAKHVRDHIDSFLSATQVGITLASLALGWIGEPLMSLLIEPFFALFNISPGVLHSVSFGLGFLILTSIHIVFGEQIAKVLAINYEVEVALVAARPLVIYYRIFFPLIWGLNKMVDAVLNLFGLPKASEEGGHTREELRNVFLESARRGVVEREESTIMESLFEFGEKTVREIMVHRSEVVAIDLDMEPRQILRVIEDEGYSRLPVFRDSFDHIVGVLHVKDLFPVIGQLERLSVPSHEADKDFRALLERSIRPALFVSETQPISQLLLEFQKRRVHMGVVASEHGGVEGIVTLEDILEELVGEIRDESDTSEAPDVIEKDGAIYIDPTMTVAEFNQQFDSRLPTLEESGDYQTISGYVQKHAGRIPAIGDAITVNGLRFTVTRKVRHKLEQIKIEQLPVPSIDASPTIS
ncbi:MAG: hemolysin family protein [Bacteroidota bacterium]|nr:hemolysin family protein [Bacteroidota bacterium]MDP4233144.1 hemolysin family protein [Bacteroidota bacterium]MDP4241711.1 hemolysin family protein [Bacteroidota bacterium]MDP4287369.1 hemolysin family protein [Bacteroidota bacterium]